MNSDATTQPLPIFVYGTLMIGQPNDYIWQETVHSFEVAFITDYCLYDFGYFPMMLEKPGRKVVGQLVRLEKDRFSQIIQNLDFLEGFDPDHPQESDFRRVQLQASSPTGGKIVAWTYLGNETRVQKLPVVRCGDWAKHVAERDEFIADLWQEISTVLDDAQRPGDSMR